VNGGNISSSTEVVEVVEVVQSRDQRSEVGDQRDFGSGAGI
jgi:hypothetical protein